MLNGYNQNIVGQYWVSKISAIVKNIQEFASLSQSENKLDLGGCLSERRKRSSDFCPVFLESLHNELNREESERKNIVVGENSTRVITSDHEILDIENLPIREVVINDNINRKRSLRSTLDLRKLVQQINKDLGMKPISTVIKDASDLLIKLSISATGLQQDVITVRLEDAFINKWYKKLQIIFDNAPMEIDNSLYLKPSLLISDKRIIVVTPQEVEEKNKLFISKKAGQYSYLHDKYDLIVTNAFNANIMTNNLDSSIEVSELFIIYFKDFYKEPKMKTFSIRFIDKEILLSDEIDKIYNADSIDKLNYVSSILNLQESSLPLEVSSSSDIEAQGKFKRTPLHFASEAGEWDRVRLLLDRGANIEVQDEFGYTPIFLATQSGKWSVVELLLNYGANIDAQDKEGQALLCFAVSGNNLDMVQFLLDRGASIEVQDKSGYTPILYAAQSGKWGVVKLFIDNGAKFNNETTFQGTPLHFAVQEGNLGMVQFLLDKGANIEAQDAYNKKPLHIAVDANRLNVVSLLLDRGANLKATDMYGKTPLDLAIQKGYEDIVEVLKRKQLDLDKKLLISAEKGDLEKVRDSIRQGANVNVQSRQGWTPLFWAIQKNNFNIVELLLDNSADIKVKDNEGWTPLNWAVQLGSLDVVKHLVGRGADVNALTADGRTPYDLAINQNYREIKEYLRSKSAVPSSMLIPHVILADDNVRQRRRRHHHGDHDRHHVRLSRKLLAVYSSDQTEIATSSVERSSSWINDLFSWVKSSVGGLFYSRAALPEGTSSTTTKNSILQVNAPIDVNGTIMLLDVLIRKVTGQKYISVVDQSISSLEAQGYALNITKRFEKILNETAIKSGISVTNLNFDPVAAQSVIVGQIVSEKFFEIAKTLYSFAKEACPEFKQTDKFLDHLKSNLEEVLAKEETMILQQKVEKPSKILGQQISGKVELSKKPDTFLNGASVVKGINNVLER